MPVRIDGQYLVISGVTDPQLAYSVCPQLTMDSWDGREAVVRVPWFYENVYALANVGIDCISPMPATYSFPIHRGTPYAHQIQGADFLARNRRAYMLCGAGSGKTLMASWAADYLLGIGAIRKVLVICFKPTLISAWASDLETHLPHLPFMVLTDDNPKKREKKFKSATPVHLINHDGPALFWPELAANAYDLIVYDESTAIKNDDTNRFKGAYQLVQKRPEVRIWAMTATPTAQSPEDAYGQIRFMGNVDRDGNRAPPNPIFGGVFMDKGTWRDLVTTTVGRKNEKAVRVPRSNANEIVFHYMRPAFARRTRDCVDLPPEVVLPTSVVPAGKAQAKAWEAMKKEHTVTVGDQVASVKSPVAVLSKVLQIGCGILYADDVGDPWDEFFDSRNIRPTIEFDVTHKNEEMLRLIREAEGKSIVYVPFTAAILRVAAFLRGKGIHVEAVYGDQTPAHVHEAVNGRFQSTAPDSPQVLVAQPQKISHGVTATAANMTIWYAPILKGEVYQQANLRTGRIGQTRTQFLAHISCSPLETARYKQSRDNHNRQQDFFSLYEGFMSGTR